MIPDYLNSECAADICESGAACPEAVKVNAATGRAFITLGHAGFNSHANNGAGYATIAAAEAAIKRYSRGGRAWGAYGR